MMIIVLNNKSCFNLEEFQKYTEELSNIKNKNLLIFCPSLCFLPLCNDMEITLGSQYVSSNNSLYTTGEVTARQLHSLKVDYCIVGHSDRGENEIEVLKKINCLIEYNIIPILCFGENNIDDDIIEIKKNIINKINFVTKDLSNQTKDKILLAYEPKWAVNGNQHLDFEKIREILQFLKTTFPNNKVLYGGGINKNNYSELVNLNGLDGLLLGRMGNDLETLNLYL